MLLHVRKTRAGWACSVLCVAARSWVLVVLVLAGLCVFLCVFVDSGDVACENLECHMIAYISDPALCFVCSGLLQGAPKKLQVRFAESKQQQQVRSMSAAIYLVPARAYLFVDSLFLSASFWVCFSVQATSPDEYVSNRATTLDCVPVLSFRASYR